MTLPRSFKWGQTRTSLQPSVHRTLLQNTNACKWERCFLDLKFHGLKLFRVKTKPFLLLLKKQNTCSFIIHSHVSKTCILMWTRVKMPIHEAEGWLSPSCADWRTCSHVKYQHGCKSFFEYISILVKHLPSHESDMYRSSHSSICKKKVVDKSFHKHYKQQNSRDR